MLVQFYTAIIESILTSSITVWFAGATVRDKQRLQRIVRSAEEVIGRSLPSLQDLLHVAAARGQTECLVAILSQGVDLSITDSAGLSPLHLAAKNNHPECCKKLIQCNCQIDALDSLGKTALHHAAASGSVQTVQLLCKQKSPINIRDAVSVF
uniref:Uncharacterized protein n=1 Tax=Knipowitschia caucasica TaxID=637954 RepID=A0AAV2IZW3_KNICA